MTKIEIQLKKKNKTYTLGEAVAGVCIIESQKEFSHQGINLQVIGEISMREPPKETEELEMIFRQTPNYELLKINFSLAPNRKIQKGRTEIPFEFLFQPLSENKLIETYHGEFIQINYVLSISIFRRKFSKKIIKSVELIAKLPPKKNYTVLAKDFIIRPNSIENLEKETLEKIGEFLIRGKITSLICPIGEPFTGHLQVISSTKKIQSIDLELIRQETCGMQNIGFLKEESVIQTVQLVNGNVSGNVKIPIYMLFPKLFTCPTFKTLNYKISFKINIVIHFVNDIAVREHFQIEMIRTN
ncbi:vacuolar protein sorting-associated protein 26c [Anaeramoeba flamelloides]|uniref:Vacuolar protein sorting-associated protein 26c n=1 Tax=Anaeramoeba flamelloides TaxID=1746091 RepID=A0ABQ8XVM3_9EUKA|nr:vacuolar protein sorting-associated protein 26c [Anaeramoeba flamelloides]